MHILATFGWGNAHIGRLWLTHLRLVYPRFCTVTIFCLVFEWVSHVEGNKLIVFLVFSVGVLSGSCVRGWVLV